MSPWIYAQERTQPLKQPPFRIGAHEAALSVFFWQPSTRKGSDHLFYPEYRDPAFQKARYPPCFIGSSVPVRVRIPRFHRQTLHPRGFGSTISLVWPGYWGPKIPALSRFPRGPPHPEGFGFSDSDRQPSPVGFGCLAYVFFTREYRIPAFPKDCNHPCFRGSYIALRVSIHRFHWHDRLP